MSVPFKYKGLEHSNNINFDSFTVVNFDLYFEYYKRPLSYESKILYEIKSLSPFKKAQCNNAICNNFFMQ